MTFELMPLTIENYEHIVSPRGSNQPSIDDLLYHEKISSG